MRGASLKGDSLNVDFRCDYIHAAASVGSEIGDCYLSLTTHRDD